MTGLTVILWLCVAMVAVAAIVLITVVVRRIRAFSQTAFNTDSLMAGLEKMSQELAETPKSIPDLSRIVMPQINRDFPELNLTEWQAKVQNALETSWLALTNQDLSLLATQAPELVTEYRNAINELQSQGQKEFYQDCQIHKIAITEYQKSAGKCAIIYNAAAGHIWYKLQNGVLVAGNQHVKTQSRYQIDLVYVQDPAKLSNGQNTAVTTNCPNCGAVVTSLGHKYCEYCGAAITAIEAKVWQISRISKI